MKKIIGMISVGLISSISLGNEYNVIISKKGQYIIGTSNEEAPYLGESCNDILLDGKNKGDGYYFIGGDESNKIEVYCDMSTNGGGWTLVTRLNTEDSNERRWDNSFWTDEQITGALKGSQDYMSPYRSNISAVKEVLLEFNYDSGVLKSAFTNNSNTLSYQELLTQTPSLTNVDFSKSYSENNESNDFFGNILSFQVDSNDVYSDKFRIWYNKTEKNHCNQSGGIGLNGDIGNLTGWSFEAGYSDDYNSCQENYYRSYLGTNKGGSHSVINSPASENNYSHPEYYTTDIINVYIK